MSDRSFIVKVQRSLAPRGRVLIYDESRSVFFECADEDVTDGADLLEEGWFKAYFHAHLDEQNRIILDDLAEEQAW